MLVIYSLKVDSIIELSPDAEKAQTIDQLLDSERKSIVKRTSVNSSGCATARGAGLLLQYSGQKALNNQLEAYNEDVIDIKELSIEGIIEELKETVDFQYIHGDEGKPYWKNEKMPFFNISHSDGIVVIAISDSELGIDIQKIKSKNELQMAKRFYSEKEAGIVADSEAQGFDVFYRLWARKEALGKCTGKGVRPYLEVDLSDLEIAPAIYYQWLETKYNDCFVCICKKATL